MLERSSIVKGDEKAAPQGSGLPISGRIALVGLVTLPAGFSGAFGDSGALLTTEGFGACVAALESPHASQSDGSGVLGCPFALASGTANDGRGDLVEIGTAP